QHSTAQPDWAFMEAFVKQKERLQIGELMNKLSSQAVDLLIANGGLKEREWGEFLIGNLFTIKIGKSIDGNKVDRKTGKTAYITRKESHNGLDGFIDDNSELLNIDYPVITIGNETAEPFVQNYPFFTGTKVNILKAKSEISLSALQFIATSLRMHKSKYSYSFTINSTRLKQQKILLPIDQSGDPDWQFMEAFMKKIEQDKIKTLLSYYNKATIFAERNGT
ncbi:restriction endonuclease, partial [Pasteurellaceae bacterium Phil11]